MQITYETLNTPAMADDPQQLARTEKALRSKSFGVLSTVSSAGFPHAAGVIYEQVDGSLYVHTMRSSRKARNVVANPRVAMVVPVRRLPVGPPFTVQFQGHAEQLAMDDPQIQVLLEAGHLKKISGHGALDEPDGCFMRITPQGSYHTYGIGVSALAVARDPLHNGPRSVAVS